MNAIKYFIYKNIIPLLGTAFKNRNKYINVIYYHDVVKGEGDSFMRTSLSKFKQQMQYIVDNGYVTKRFDDLRTPDDVLYDEKTVLIAFDDGWLSTYSEIFEYMESYGIKYNVFLEVGKIGTNPDYLSWDQIRDMYSSGTVGFGAHTYTHPDMTSLSGISLKHEIDDANDRIEKELGIVPRDFCFPYGAYSEETLQVITDMKVYSRIYTSDLNYSYLKKHTVIFGRNAISNDEDFTIFVNKLKGRYNMYHTIKKLF